MALMETRYLYEALVRFDRDGYKASHAVYMNEIVKDGKVMAATQEPAIPVPTVEELQAVLGQAVIDHGDQVDKLRAELAQVREELTQVRNDLKTSEAKNAELTEENWLQNERP